MNPGGTWLACQTCDCCHSRPPKAVEGERESQGALWHAGGRAVLFIATTRSLGVSSMSAAARANLCNGKKSALVLELARTGEAVSRADRDSRDDRDLLERLEAENLELRNWAVQLALQIQILRRIGRSEVGSASRSRA